MKRDVLRIPLILILTSLLLSACVGLIPLEDDIADSEYGPVYSPQDHQTRTFNALWEKLQNNYIYYEESEVDWDSLREQYADRISTGLTPDEFTALI